MGQSFATGSNGTTSSGAAALLNSSMTQVQKHHVMCAGALPLLPLTVLAFGWLLWVACDMGARAAMLSPDGAHQ